MERKTTSLRIDPELWKRVRKYCIDKDLEVSVFIERLLRRELK